MSLATRVRIMWYAMLQAQTPFSRVRVLRAYVMWALRDACAESQARAGAWGRVRNGYVMRADGV